ncbi:MAG: AraC family transcriptional regulator [Clostridia bacterium]|nr:AraC family transcriptional regulator [Clostridia bacterium]
MPIDCYAINTYLPEGTINVSEKSIDGVILVHRHEFYEIELILRGGGIYNIDGIDYEMKPGSLFIMSPVSFHCIQFTGEAQLVNLMFTADVCSAAFLSELFFRRPHMMCQLSPEDTHLIHLLAGELSRHLCDGGAYDLYAETVLNCVLGKLCSLQGGVQQPGKISPIQYAVLYMQNHFTEPIQLEDAAGIANYSPNYFSSQFKAYTGVTFKQYLTDLRFSFAKKLLEHTELSVSQICTQCGFSDFSHFMSGFKKKYGITPKNFRENTGKSQEL